MKNKKFRNIAIVVILFILLLALKQATNLTEGLDYPPYTSFSTGEEGAALLYDTLKIMGYPVGRDSILISRQKNTDNIQIVIAPIPQYASQAYEEGLLDWVVRGGSLLYFKDGYGTLESRMTGNYKPDAVTAVAGGTLYRIGTGQVYIGAASDVININLMKDGEGIGQPLVDLIDTFHYEKIVFNEAYHGYNEEKGLMESLPPGIRILAMQVVVLAVVLVLFLGKRFGKAVPYYEEIEREENEYVATLTNLYMSTGFGNVALEVYDNKLKNKCAAYFRNADDLTYDQIMDLWLETNLPHLDKLQYIIQNRDKRFNTKRRKNKKEFMKMAACYRELIQTVSKLQ